MDLVDERPDTTWGVYRAERVYALMGFFEHGIQPTRSEDDLRALMRQSMVNDNDRIIERMVSMLPSSITPTACWYVDTISAVRTYGIFSLRSRSLV